MFIPRPGAHKIGVCLYGLGGKRNLAGKGRVARRILSGPFRATVTRQLSTVDRLPFWSRGNTETPRVAVLPIMGNGVRNGRRKTAALNAPRRKHRDYFIKSTERARLISRVIFRCMCAGIPVTLRGRIFPLSVTNFLRRSGFL